MTRTRRLRRTAVMAAAVLTLCGCAAADTAPTATPSSSVPASPSASPTPNDPTASMSLSEKVAQLFMVGTPVDAVNDTTLAAVRDDGVGGLFLHGRSTDDIDATAALVDQFTGFASSELPLWVATDQEGGQVQVLSGPGFDDIPSAVEQGQMDAAALRSAAATWGEQLARAGITMNLAPVADIVPNGSAATNPPIGALHRQYGGDEKAVAAGAGAFAAGMRDAGILPTLKHFPGLGYVTANTDFSTGVVDDVVTAGGPDMGVYRTLLGEGAAVVMMSTAIYANIDPELPAAFSSDVISLLRDDIGFNGVITTDDLSAASQVSAWPPAQRATMAIDAGVDLLLVSSDPSVYPEMRDAVLERAKDDPDFASKVDAAAHRIAAAKAE
ncbi:glycoside hydrolase family 3 N-terminal domain-containing protein [Paramicrobacterium agarici]|uniref:glycoside hydrolase family 3 N-terminal domain-containing protein n=1 Tax=Paramicrobacterium agarici TaxID=630514 RepID=UPI001FE6FF96|nr:glycoside hydrolase family 3 N-terminal domain-containing protein [Microbacterium agarici]